MGWNSSVVLIEGHTVAQVEQSLPDVFAVTGRLVDWCDAIRTAMHPGAALGEIPG